MNFNGKYWHKPGHLGMTTDEVKKALQTLPTPEAGDAGKAVVVNEDADGYELGEAGGGEWTAKFTVHLDPQNMKLEETMAEIQAFAPVLGDRVAIIVNSNIFAYTTVVSANYSGATLIKIYLGTDLFAPNIKQFVSLNSGKYELSYLNTTSNETLTPRVFDWDGTTLNLTEYDSAIVFSLASL